MSSSIMTGTAILDATKNHIAARKPPTPNMNEKRTVSAVT